MATAPPVMASASRRMWLGAGAGRPLVAIEALVSSSTRSVAERLRSTVGWPAGAARRTPARPGRQSPRTRSPSTPPHPTDTVRETASVLHLEDEGEDHGTAIQPLEI